MNNTFDLIVIGAGPGGYVAAIKGAQTGMKTAVIERGTVGGTCLNRGCVPTKTLLHAGQLRQELDKGTALGIHVGEVSVDMKQVTARRDEVVTQLREGVEGLLKANHITLIRGSAKIQSPGQVAVTTSEAIDHYEAKNILIAAGSMPARLPLEGMELAGVLTSDDLLEGESRSFQKLVIIGGGVIGVEFATAYHALGCEVTIIEAADRILPVMDKEISQNLSMILKRRGITIHTGAAVEKVTEGEEGLTCHFVKKGEPSEATGEAVLVAVGRKPDMEGLFAPGFSVECKKGIAVNEHFQTSVPSIYAIGDVIEGSIQLAHAASAQGSCAVAHMKGKKGETEVNVIPACVYTDPEIACVGMTAAEAAERGMEVKTGKYIMNGNAKSVIEQQDRGFIKILFDASTEQVLGAQLMCARATDLVSELTTAIVNRLTVHELVFAVRPHPTFAEGISEAAEDALGIAVHLAPKKKPLA